MIRRSIRLISADPSNTSQIRSQNVAALKSQLSSNQQKKVEFIADKLFDLDDLEIAYINKHLSADEKFSSVYGGISFDKFKSAKVRNGYLSREKRRIRKRSS